MQSTKSIPTIAKINKGEKSDQKSGPGDELFLAMVWRV